METNNKICLETSKEEIQGQTKTVKKQNPPGEENISEELFKKWDWKVLESVSY